MVCALVYAYFLHKVWEINHTQRYELVLRSDSVALLSKTGLSPDLLLFRDQLDLRDLQRRGGLRLTLVDHNVLPDSDSDLEGAVVEVIDHHKLERVTSCCPVAVEPVGSCATLVAERVLQGAPQLLDSVVGTLLYGTVLVDCVDMSPDAGKVTPKDSEVLLKLEASVQTLPQRSELFKELQLAKFDVSGLDSEQMLMKDLKSVSGPDMSLGISVLYLPLQDFLVRPGVEAELSAFSQTMGYDSLLLMSISFTESQQPIRELGVFSLRQPIREQVSLYLEHAHNPNLELRPISCSHPHVSAFHQGNTAASRKKLLPLLKDFLLTLEQDVAVPPTPVNSLIEGCPLDQGLDLQDINPEVLYIQVCA
uniref:Prune exopolyphosphatase n=1 Tax=Neogobius melanostomus TaxID=47308 RepID=A0A8C6UD71_9GOBI